MINITKDELVFLHTGAQLHSSIVESFRDASKWILQAYGLQNINLSIVTTKCCVEAALPAHVERYILRDHSEYLDAQYVKDVHALVGINVSDIPPELYAAVTRNPQSASGKMGGYRRAYIRPLKRGFSAFLVAMHIRRAIVLPFSFQWPQGHESRKKGAVQIRRQLCPLEYLPELLMFIRSVNPRSDGQQTEDVFNAYNQSQRERHIWMGLRLIVAAGWLNLSDVNYEDMLALKFANDKTNFSGGHPTLGLHMLADLFEQKFGKQSPITSVGWRKALNTAMKKDGLERIANSQKMSFSKKTNDLNKTRNLNKTSDLNKTSERFEKALSGESVNLLEHIFSITATDMAPDVLAEMDRLPGLEFDLKVNAEVWIASELTFLRKIKRESTKARSTAMGHLNLYLFAYLPHWYVDHPDFKFEFPLTPEKLITSVFISELGLLDGQERPMTLTEFLSLMAIKRGWLPNVHYSYMKQIEKFFEFIENYNDSLPGAKGFRQPLQRHDYPPVMRSVGTNKRPIPRRVFKLFMSYLEALLALSAVLIEKMIFGEINFMELTCLEPIHNTVNCYKHQDSFGFVPIVFYKGRTVPLWIIPNVFPTQVKKLKTGCITKVPHPHALHQIIVSLYTGLRQNHIQWLDNMTFDKYVDDVHGSREFAELFVNTDKTMTHPWKPFVNFRVIEILRLQRAWRNLIDEPGFKEKIFYNNNPQTKWGSFYPLFAYYTNGQPHSDSLYRAYWNRLLSGLQVLLGQLGENGNSLVRLLPKNVAFNDQNMDEKLRKYGDSQTRICDISLKTDITPHSARVSVVSHGIGILPADLIGRYWTGQTEATVYHYVVLDEEETYAEQQRQNLALKQHGYEQGYEAMLKASPGRKSQYIKADDINSNLSKSLKANLEETIIAYGCISLSFEEETKTGLDVLRETRAVGAVENKTEICPYGNQCPPELVAQLKGWKRCGPCQFAVRSIDHLQAITAKIRQVIEGLSEIEVRIVAANSGDNITSDELDVLEKTRDALAEDLAAWQMAAEVLEVMRHRIASGESTKSWHVQKPEIIEKHLSRALFPTQTTEYVLARLQESEAFPMLESPQIRARFELLRRQLLANTGNIRAALSLENSANPGAECLGLLRSIVAAHHLTLADLKGMLESDSYLDAIPNRPFKLFPKEVE